MTVGLFIDTIQDLEDDKPDERHEAMTKDGATKRSDPREFYEDDADNDQMDGEEEGAPEGEEEEGDGEGDGEGGIENENEQDEELVDGGDDEKGGGKQQVEGNAGVDMDVDPVIGEERMEGGAP